MGFVNWVLRGGALAATLLTSMPMWKGFDPLPLLARRKRKKKKKEEVSAEDAASVRSGDPDVDHMFGTAERTAARRQDERSSK